MQQRNQAENSIDEHLTKELQEGGFKAVQEGEETPED